MRIKQKSKKWAESRGAALVGAPLKPSHDAEQLYRLTLQKAVERMRKDYASEREELIRDKALRSRIKFVPGTSETWCIDCGDVIPHKRRAIVPGVKRCVDCQDYWERRSRR